MKKITFYASFFLLFISNPSYIFAQAKGNGNISRAEGNVNYNKNAGNSSLNNTNDYSPTQAYFLNDSTIVLQVNTLMNVKADQYVAIMSLTQAGETARIANEFMERRIQDFTTALVNQGLATKETIYIDFISQIPTYSYEIEKKVFSKTANEVPSGFELQKNLHISYKNPVDLDKIMLIASEFEIYDLVKVDYDIYNMESVYDTLRAKSTQLLQSKLNSFKALNIHMTVEVLKYTTIAEGIESYYPVDMYDSYMAFSSNNLGRTYKTTNVQKKPETYYYKKLDYKHFDAVINPVVIEPVIQFAYNLSVKYSLKKK